MQTQYPSFFFGQRSSTFSIFFPIEEKLTTKSSDETYSNWHVSWKENWIKLGASSYKILNYSSIPQRAKNKREKEEEIEWNLF